MKQYVIDQLRPADYFKLKSCIEMNCQFSGFPGIYWLILPDDMLEKIQIEHQDCKPFYFALELSEFALSCEFLIRTIKSVRCDCMGYASVSQRNWLIQTIDDFFHQLEITV